MEITSRQKVFATVRKHQLLTVSEICLLLDMRPANTRHHLSILKAEGLIEEMEFHRSGGKGRPEKVFAVSNAFKEDGLENLTSGILNIWGLKTKNDELNNNFKALAHQLAGDAGEFQYLGITNRLSSCVENLNMLHYQAKWEAGPSGPRIRLGNCPYWKIINQFPELCKMDKNLLEELAGFKMLQISKMERDERGSLECSFIGD